MRGGYHNMSMFRRLMCDSILEKAVLWDRTEVVGRGHKWKLTPPPLIESDVGTIIRYQ